MSTQFRVLFADGATLHASVDWPRRIDDADIAALAAPYCHGDPIEHVRVLYQGEEVSMILSEAGRSIRPGRSPLKLNHAATAIYRHRWRVQYRGLDPDSLPVIAGNALLFDRLILP